MKSTKKPTHFFEKNKTIDDPTDANDKIIAYYKILALIFLVLMKQKCCFCIKVRKFFPFKCEPVRFFCFVFFLFFWNSPIERLTPWKKKMAWRNVIAVFNLDAFAFAPGLFISFVCLFCLFVPCFTCDKTNGSTSISVAHSNVAPSFFFFFGQPEKVEWWEKKRNVEFFLNKISCHHDENPKKE